MNPAGSNVPTCSKVCSKVCGKEVCMVLFVACVYESRCPLCVRAHQCVKACVYVCVCVCVCVYVYVRVPTWSPGEVKPFFIIIFSWRSKVFIFTGPSKVKSRGGGGGFIHYSMILQRAVTMPKFNIIQ